MRTRTKTLKEKWAEADRIAQTVEALPPLPGYGHLSDYAPDLHIVTGPNGVCRCGEDGLTCGQRLAAVSYEIRDAITGAEMGRGGAKFVRSHNHTNTRKP